MALFELLVILFIVAIKLAFFIGIVYVGVRLANKHSRPRTPGA